MPSASTAICASSTPPPRSALDLATWQEFHGFDLTGRNANFEVDIDVDALTMTVTHAEPRPSSPFVRIPANMVEGYEKLPAVKRDPKIEVDFFGNPVKDDRMAGPFAVDSEKVTLNRPEKALSQKNGAQEHTARHFFMWGFVPAPALPARRHAGQDRTAECKSSSKPCSLSPRWLPGSPDTPDQARISRRV